MHVTQEKCLHADILQTTGRSVQVGVTSMGTEVNNGNLPQM